MPLLALALALAFVALVAKSRCSQPGGSSISSLSIEGQGCCDVALFDCSIFQDFSSARHTLLRHGLVAVLPDSVLVATDQGEAVHPPLNTHAPAAAVNSTRQDSSATASTLARTRGDQSK